MKSIDDHMKLIAIESTPRKLSKNELDVVMHTCLKFNEKEVKEVTKLLGRVAFFIETALNRGMAEERARKKV